MVMLLLSMLCIGAALAARFKVFVLIPAIGLAFILVLAGGIAHGDGASTILIAGALASISLQVGYLCGIVMRHGITEIRARHPHKDELHAKSAR